MDAINELLDIAAKVCGSDAGLSRRIEVTRTTVSGWRHARYPMPQERVVQIARIARENEGYWLARVEAEQSLGDTRKAWEKVAAALPRVAMIALVLGGVFAQFPAAAHNLNDWQSKHYAKLRRICANFTRWLAGFRHGFAPSSLLA